MIGSAECVEAWEKKCEEEGLRVVYRKMKPSSSGIKLWWSVGITQIIPYEY